MTDFFEKLKKGMDKGEVLDNQNEAIEEPLNEELASKQEEIIEPPKKPKKVMKKPKRVIKKVKIKKEKEVDFEKVSIEQEDDLFDSEGELTVDVFQSGKDLIIQSAIAGIDSEDLDITIENDLVIIKGERAKRFTEEENNYFFQECYWGKFSREIILPVEVDSSRAEASMKKGILTIRIPVIKSRRGKTKVSVK